MRNKIVLLIAITAASGFSRTVPGTVSAQIVDSRANKPFRSSSELVTTAVTVRDAEGRLITSLNQQDFVVEEDGVAQPITLFTQERVPVSLS
ncbi:MAG: hypothetical protein ACKOEC_17490 [Acidimicrobiia bacterium]